MCKVYKKLDRWLVIISKTHYRHEFCSILKETNGKISVKLYVSLTLDFSENHSQYENVYEAPRDIENVAFFQAEAEDHWNYQIMWVCLKIYLEYIFPMKSQLYIQQQLLEFIKGVISYIKINSRRNRLWNRLRSTIWSHRVYKVIESI